MKNLTTGCKFLHIYISSIKMASGFSTFKVVLLGDAGVGKTSVFSRYLPAKDKFSPTYTPTVGCEVLPLSFFTNYGHVFLDVFDTPGDLAHTESYYSGADIAIAMFDISTRKTFLNLTPRIREFQKTSPLTQIHFLGNKVDQALHYKKGTGFAKFSVSAKSKQGMDEFMLWLLRALTHKKDLVLVE